MSISAFERTFALLDHLRSLAASLPESEVSREGLLSTTTGIIQNGDIITLGSHFQRQGHETGVEDELRRLRVKFQNASSIQFDPLTHQEHIYVERVVAGYAETHPSVSLDDAPEGDVLHASPVSDALNPFRTCSQKNQSESQPTSREVRPSRLIESREAATMESSSKQRPTFAAEFQAALDARLAEAEEDFHRRLVSDVKEAREEGYTQGSLDGAMSAQEELRVLRTNAGIQEGELARASVALKRAHMDQTRLDAKVTNVREESKRNWAQIQKFGDLDPDALREERVQLEVERDYYYKLSFRTVAEDLKALGSAGEHQKQHQLLIQQRLKEEADRAELQQRFDDLERRFTTACARVAICESKISKYKSMYRSLRSLLERQNTVTMGMLDPSFTEPVGAMRSARESVVGLGRSTVRSRDGGLPQLLDDIVDFSSSVKITSLQKQFSLTLEGWVGSLLSADPQSVESVVGALAEIGVSNSGGLRKSVNGIALLDASAQVSSVVIDSGIGSSQSILGNVRLGLQHLHETAVKVDNAQGRFLGRLKPFLMPSRVSRSMPKPTVQSLMDAGTISAFPEMDALVAVLQHAEGTMLQCIHKLASYEVKPAPPNGSGKDSPKRLMSPKSNGGGGADDLKGLTEAQRRRRWLMIKSTAMMEEAVNTSQSAGGARGSVSSPIGPQGKIAIVFTDIQSSTLLWQLYSDKMSIALKAHNIILRDAIVAFNGYEVKTIGDAFMIAFANPQDAVNYCMAIQDNLMKHSWDEVFNKAVEPTMTRVLEDAGTVPKFSLWNGLRVRVGIHYGEPLSEFDTVTKRTDYFGPMVNLSARVQGVALGGQTLISPQILEAIALENVPVPCTLSSGGTHTLKGIDHPVKLFSIMPTHLSKRDADFEDQVRQKTEKEGKAKAGGGTTSAGVDPMIERLTVPSKLLTFVVLVCQRLPELTDDQWNFCISLAFDSAKNTALLCNGYVSKQSATVLQMVFENPGDALRFGCQIQLSCVRLDYGDDVAEMTDFASTSPGGDSVLLYRGINPKVGIHQCAAQGDFDVFSNRVVFKHSEGLAIVAGLALNARLGEILVSDVVMPYVDERALKAVSLPSAVVVPDASPVQAHVLVPIELEERIQMRPEFATEDLRLDENIDEGAGDDLGPVEDDLFKAGDCMKCEKPIGPLCLKCITIECKACRREFNVPKRCSGCSSGTNLRRSRNGNGTPQQSPLVEPSFLDMRPRAISANDLIGAVRRTSSSRSQSIGGSPKPNPSDFPPALLHPTFLSDSTNHYNLSHANGSTSSLARAESGLRFNRSMANSGANPNGNLSITGTGSAVGDGSIARSRLQNALRHRLGGAGASSSAVSFASMGGASIAGAENSLSIDGGSLR